MGPSKTTETKKKEMFGWLNASVKCTETRVDPSTTLYLQSKINFFPPTDTAHQYKEGNRSSKKVQKPVTEKTFTSYEKKGDVWMAKHFSNKTLGRALDPRDYGAWLSKLTE